MNIQNVSHYKDVCQDGIARLKATLSWAETIKFLGNEDMAIVGEIIDTIKERIQFRQDEIKRLS